jgi:cold shock CspA family protein
MATGTITSIRPDRGDGHGFGVITPDGGGPDLSFASEGTEGAGQSLRRVLHNLRRPAIVRRKPFDQLRVGQRVTFRMGVDPFRTGRAGAEQVRRQDGPLYALDCACGERLGAADRAALFRVAQAHVAHAHPGRPLTDEQLRQLIAADAYLVEATTAPMQLPGGQR